GNAAGRPDREGYAPHCREEQPRSARPPHSAVLPNIPPPRMFAAGNATNGRAECSRPETDAQSNLLRGRWHSLLFSKTRWRPLRIRRRRSGLEFECKKIGCRVPLRLETNAAA